MAKEGDMIPDIASREELVEYLSSSPGACEFSWSGDADLLGDRGPGDEGWLLGRAFVITTDGNVSVSALG